LTPGHMELSDALEKVLHEYYLAEASADGRITFDMMLINIL